MLSPSQVIDQLSVDEFIVMCRLSPAKFDVEKVTRTPSYLMITITPRDTKQFNSTFFIDMKKAS